MENFQFEDVFCIVGYPNLSQYTSITEPLFSDQKVKDLINEIQKYDNNSSYASYSLTNKYNSTRTYQSNLATEFSTVKADNDGGDDSDDDETQSGTKDFHLYRFADIPLKCNEKALLSVFEIEIPYREVYQCKIDGKGGSNREAVTPEVFFHIAIFYVL